MIYFVTDKTNHQIPKDSTIEMLTPEDAESHLQRLSFDNNTLGYDLETTGLDAYTSQILLYCIGNAEDQYIIDAVCMTPTQLLKSDTTWIGHNLYLSSILALRLPSLTPC